MKLSDVITLTDSALDDLDRESIAAILGSRPAQLEPMLLRVLLCAYRQKSDVRLSKVGNENKRSH